MCRLAMREKAAGARARETERVEVSEKGEKEGERLKSLATLAAMWLSWTLCP